ncbi:aspartate dehydrogenase [Ramlibacter tataouinensis]|uniref:aspartate dehydrogenase n=1 Tax=Ramlibacter tataouinensis TaxID=94132 RepID=UPI0022F3F72B|nr:aspartate dehydrogenase [Ramlibacter tataouinensis]WBY03003.1 aspartate dehydrogenase [Ramlibacter tataouinensis]
MLKIAVIGCGAISQAVLQELARDGAVEVAAVVVRPESLAEARAKVRDLAPRAEVCTELPQRPFDLVVEAAGHAAIEQHVVPALSRGVPCVIVSIGALAAPGVAERLERAARAGSAQVRLISGAIGALDALAAARQGGLDTVTYTGCKPPHAWEGLPAANLPRLADLREPETIFEGSAREACALFPKNANVAAAISIAGVGMEATRVRLVADPSIRENAHKVHACGDFGELELVMRNKALASNPKTSLLTVFSVLRAVRSRLDPVLI